MGLTPRCCSLRRRNQDFEAVNDISFEIDLPATHDLVSDRQGRVFELHGHANHAAAPRSDPHRELKRGLAHKIADALQTSLADQRYDKLVLVAPPTTLGDLREALRQKRARPRDRRACKRPRQDSRQPAARPLGRRTAPRGTARVNFHGSSPATQVPRICTSSGMNATTSAR